MEIEYAFEIKQSKQSITEKQKYEMQLKRKEIELIKDMEIMGDQGVDAMQRRVE